MSVKSDFLQALNDPEILQDWNQIVFPAVPTVGWPTTENEAIIACGQFQANCNLWLKVFEGMPVLQLLLRGGQFNETLQGILLANLEYLQHEGTREIAIRSPEGGQIFPPITEFDVIVQIVTYAERVNQVSCLLDGQYPISLTKEGEDQYINTISTDVGSHTISVSVSYVDTEFISEASVTFDVQS